MANVNFMTLAVWRLFRCQAYDKKVRWTFFSVSVVSIVSKARPDR